MNRAEFLTREIEFLSRSLWNHCPLWLSDKCASYESCGALPRCDQAKARARAAAEMICAEMEKEGRLH